MSAPAAPPKVFTRDSFVIATPPLAESPVDSRPPSPSSSAFAGLPRTLSASQYTSGVSTPATSNAPSRSASHSKDPLLKRTYGSSREGGLVTSLWQRLQDVLAQDDKEHRGRANRRLSMPAQDDRDTQRTKPGRLNIASKLRPSRTFAQRAIAYCMISLVGFNDSATGANLDSMREHYAVSYNVISTVFLSNIAGYFVSCVLASFLTHHLGLNYSLLVAAAFMAAGCLTMALVPPFPVFVLALAALGFGGGVYDASLTTVVAHDEDARTMSYLYACFGVGAVIASLLVGALLDRHVPWNYYYLIPMGISLVLAVAGFFTFRTYEPPADEPVADDIQLASMPPTADDNVVHARAKMSVQARMKRTLSMRPVLIGFILIVIAFGTGDTLSAWMVSFMVQKRGSPSAASRYQLAGLWGGIALGRVVLGMVGTSISEKKFSIGLLSLASACLSIVWAVKQYVVNAVFLCIAGFFLGPVTPKVLSAVGARVPPSLKSTAMSLTIGCGLIGSGLGPLLFGLVAGNGWLGSLPGVLIVTSMLGCLAWVMLPRNDRRDD